MSAEAVGWVYRFSPYAGATFAVHLALADTVSDVHDYELWMALGKLARKARCTRRSAQKAVDTMVGDGLLILVEQSAGGRSRPSRYRMAMPRMPAVWEPRARGGDPTKLRPEFTVDGVETVKRGPETASSLHTRRTQHEPKNNRVRHVCQRCGGGPFDTIDDYCDHVEACDTDAALDDLEPLPRPLAGPALDERRS